MSTPARLTDAQWARIEPFLPHRPVVEGCIYRLKGGIPWRMLPRQCDAWQTVHPRHQRWSQDGTWARILAALPAQAETAGDGQVLVDSTISRVHQHGATGEVLDGADVAHRGLCRTTGIGRFVRTHALGDGEDRLLVCSVSLGESGDPPVPPRLLDELWVNSQRRGRPRTPWSRCAATRRTPHGATGNCPRAQACLPANLAPVRASCR